MSFAESLLPPLVTLSLAAAGIHFAVLPEHLTEYPVFGYLFLALAWFQVLWPACYMLRPVRLAGLAAILVNLGAVLVWVLSRTTGLPFGPEPGHPEALGPLDLVASAFEIVLASVLALLWHPRSRASFERVTMATRSGWLGAVLWSALIVAIGSAALLSSPPVMAMP